MKPRKVYILPSQYDLQYNNGGELYVNPNDLLTWLEKKKNERLRRMQSPQYDWERHRDDGMATAYQVVIDKIKSL